MGWFWADRDDSAISASATAASATAAAPAKCPVDHSKFTSKFGRKNPTCPVKHDSPINPLNNMPELSARMAPGQKIPLPTQRTLSSIPRGATPEEGVWEYPSPQQMFNAMLRKNSAAEIPEDAVESMVDIHNFLNEGAWQEILKWEKPYSEQVHAEPRLLQFTGRPDNMSPKATLYQILGTIWPKYAVEPPFDRHDWTVQRGGEQGKKVRYVIDFYSGPDDENGMPTFYLDVRPALDDVGSAVTRLEKWSSEVWRKAMGKAVEE